MSDHVIDVRYDAVVLGLGAMGSAALLEFARRGVHVCGIEQYAIAHHLGSSHGETRIIRKAYFEHASYIPLLESAYEGWQSLERASGETLLVPCNLVVAGESGSESLRGLETSYRQYRLPHEKLTSAELQQLYPQFKLPAGYEAYLDPVAGYLLVEKCLRVQSELARQAGAELLTGERVVDFFTDTAGLVIRTDKRHIGCRKLVITTGAWCGAFLSTLELPLQVWRKTVCWFTTAELADFRPELFPMFYVELPEGDFYGFPAIDSKGVKVGEHRKSSPIAGPDELERMPLPSEEELLSHFMQTAFHGFAPIRKDASVCMYTMTPDGQFIIDRHPENEDIVFAAGFSGHGFKFAPVVGEVLVDLALTGQTPHPIDFLRLGRFSRH